jgi:predicted O-methyltransferase YrrM
MRALIRNSPLYRLYLMFYRFRFGISYFKNPLGALVAWTFHSRETSNFTYDLDGANLNHLNAFVSAVTGISVEQSEKYMAEILDNEQLKNHVRTLTEAAPFRHVSDPLARIGRRVGWYILVRATKPRVVVETGVEKGLGSCVLTAALLRNRAEGSPGRYFGTDINPEAGYLFREPYASAGEILIGDSIESLKKLDHTIDFFINDSDHSADYEYREYETVEPKLSAGALLISDNAHTNDKLFQYARRTGRAFLFFREIPKDHWYPGAGIGVAWKRAGRQD